MKGEEFKKKYLNEDAIDITGVIAIPIPGKWWHVHDDEDIPEGYVIALHPRKNIR